MRSRSFSGSLVLGVLLCAGLVLLGWQLSRGLLAFKALDRTVTVKGLSEREVPADVAIWPIKFSEVDNDLNALFSAIQAKDSVITGFLKQHGFEDDEMSVSVPAIVDRQAQGYSEQAAKQFRYSGTSTITVYSLKVEQVRAAMGHLADLGKRGIALIGGDYQNRTEFLFTHLNDVKPAMVEEATRNAREVARKFAQDSNSVLGKIRTASQGQFSIQDRDSNTPYIKKVRVVSTIQYYLSD